MGAAKGMKNRWKLAAVVYTVSLLFCLFQGGKTALMLFVFLNLLILYLFLGRWSGISQVNGIRTIANQGGASHDHTLTAGSSMEVRLQIKVPGFYPVPYVIVRDTIKRHDGQLLVFESSFVPNWKRSGAVKYQTPPLKRGEYRFLHTECVTYDIFGLFEHNGRFGEDSVFRIMPQTVVLRQWRGLQRGIRGLYSHAIASRSAKETTQLNGVREYHYGDRLSRIHWNATAKTGEWKSKAFERESLPRTLIILDRHRESYGQEHMERFELAVSAAASLLDNGLKEDTAMGLLSIGDKPALFPPKSGAEHRNAMLAHLTLVDSDAKHTIYSVLTKSDVPVEPGSFGIVITAEKGTAAIQTMEWLSRKGLTPCLLHIASPTDRIKGNNAWEQLLKARGWPVFTIRHLSELPAVLEGGDSI